MIARQGPLKANLGTRATNLFFLRAFAKGFCQANSVAFLLTRVYLASRIARKGPFFRMIRDPLEMDVSMTCSVPPLEFLTRVRKMIITPGA